MSKKVLCVLTDSQIHFFNIKVVHIVIVWLTRLTDRPETHMAESTERIASLQVSSMLRQPPLTIVVLSPTQLIFYTHPSRVGKWPCSSSSLLLALGKKEFEIITLKKKILCAVER